jgi:hypothetical protein
MQSSITVRVDQDEMWFGLGRALLTRASRIDLDVADGNEEVFNFLKEGD